MHSISDLLKERIPPEVMGMTNKERLEELAKSYNEKHGNLKFLDCPKCKNKGYIQIVRFCDFYNDYTDYMVECECMAKRKTMFKAQKSGLGDYLSKRFDDYIANDEWQANIKAKAIEYCKSNNKYWFITLGQSGAGKTLISTIIANYLLLKQDKTVMYITWTDFISKLKRDMMGDNSSEVSNYLDDVKQVEVLYIDELLKKYNETDLKYIIEIINYRYTNNLKTIISSERTIDELIEIDEATFGRVIEKAGNFIINIPKDKKKNYRLKGLL